MEFTVQHSLTCFHPLSLLTPNDQVVPNPVVPTAKQVLKYLSEEKF